MYKLCLNKSKKNEENKEFDDVVFESEEDSSGVDVIKKLREKLKQASTEKQEYLEGWQRAKADAINAKRNFWRRKV